MKTRKILAVILSVAMLLSLLTQAVWADENQSSPETVEEDLTENVSPELSENTQQTEYDGSEENLNADNYNEVQSESAPEQITDYAEDVPTPMSLLPLPTYNANVTLNRFDNPPPEEVAAQINATGERFMFAVYEVLRDVLVENGVMSEEDSSYQGDILYSCDGENSYSKVEWDEIVTSNFNNEAYTGRGYIYFILGSNDQLDPNNIKVRVYLTIVAVEIADAVFIDRTVYYPEELKDMPDRTAYVGEVVNGFLKEKGLITDENPVYSGTIKGDNEIQTQNTVVQMPNGFSLDGLLTGYWPLQLCRVNDGKYEYALGGSAAYTLFSDEESDYGRSFNVTIFYKDHITDFLSNLDEQFYNSKGEKVVDVNASSNIMFNKTMDDYTWNITNYISYTELGELEDPSIKIVFPEKYAENAKVYRGHFVNSEDAAEHEDITDLVTGGNSIKLSKPAYYINQWSTELTFVFTYDGKEYVVPTVETVYAYQNGPSIRDSSQAFSGQTRSVYSQLPQSNEDEHNYYLSVSTVYPAKTFEEAGISFYGYYYDYSEDNDNTSFIDNTKVTAAYLGKFKNEDEAKAAGAENIKDALFNDNYSSWRYVPDLSKFETKTGYMSYILGAFVSTENYQEIKYKEFDFTVFDEYGNVYNLTHRVGITGEDYVSNSVGFNIEDVYKQPYVNGSETAQSRYNIFDVNEDSYYLNGDRTIFITDGNLGEEKAIEDGTLVYPTFETDDGVTILTGKDASEPSNNAVPQISGVTPVEFRNTVSRPYSAASQGKTHIKNYWITYLTPSAGGSKLFVSAANNPDHDVEGSHVREVFLNGKYNYVHDILIANIGDQELTDISVTLENASGVKLDDYWNISDTGVKSLAPFTTVLNKPSERDENDNYVSYTGVLPNVAKIRLLPVDDQFREISGTLTVKANGQEPVVIKLTGIAGVPRITTSGLSNGVKYVPYSSVIMTNNMYDSDAVTFSLVPGSKLPKGVELYPNGEVYGVPMENGTFTFTVKASYNGEVSKDSGVDYSDTRTYTILIDDNTDDAVDAVNLADNGGYELTDRIPREIKVYYTSVDENGLPEVDRIEFEGEHFFHSIGSYENEFKYFFLDGIKLEEGVDYLAEEGSTKITVYAETFSHIGITDKDIRHTLAAEFRTEANDELKDSAQNVYLEYIEYKEQQGSGGTGGTGGGTGGMGVPSKPILSYSDQSQDAFETVDAIMTIVDANGNAIPGLKLELHSDVQYAATDDNGNASFSGVEFGRHTLYVTDAAKNTASKEFTIVSGFGADLAGDIITAEVGQTVHITISYDGQNLSIIKAETEVDIPQEGTTNDEETEGVDDTALSDDKSDEDAAPAEDEPKAVNPGTGLVLGLAPVTALAWMIVFAKRR